MLRNDNIREPIHMEKWGESCNNAVSLSTYFESWPVQWLAPILISLSCTVRPSHAFIWATCSRDSTSRRPPYGSSLLYGVSFWGTKPRTSSLLSILTKSSILSPLSRYDFATKPPPCYWVLQCRKETFPFKITKGQRIALAVSRLPKIL